MTLKSQFEIHQDIFSDFKKQLAVLDPVAFAENHLTIDGRPFDMTGNGWKFMADLYRDVAAQASSPEAKPTVILKGRQVGATVLAAVLSLYFTSSGVYGAGKNAPPMRILHAFPTLGIMSKYARDKLATIIQDSQNGYISKRLLRNDPVHGKGALDDTMTEKTFIGFNKLRVDSVGRDASRTRGLSMDGVFFDEIQDMTQEAVENCLRILTSAQHGPPMQGVQLFFGTPKNTGSYFYTIWEASDQRYYQLKCVECKDHFFLYTVGSDEWRKILMPGHDVKCPKCGHVQHKVGAIEGGRWMPTRKIDPKTGKEPKYVGYHLNVLLNPRYTKEQILDYDPQHNPARSEKAWRNETLGEFFSGGSETLTWEEIEKYAMDSSRNLSKGIKDVSDKVMVMGIDWGGKDYTEDDSSTMGQSYTAISILSIDKKGTFTVENAWRLPRNDFTYKVEVIQELFRRFRIQACAADWFYGQDVVQHMQSSLNYGAKFLGCINSGTLASTLTYKRKELRVVLNKDMMVEEIFALVRKGKFKFPVKDSQSFEQIRWLMKHMTSMEVKNIQRNGNLVRRYDKGAIPNDGLMAVLYAIVAYKFIATNGFKSVESGKKRGGRPPGPILGYMPKLR